MPKPVVYFAHGRDSGPWGVKIRTLARVAEAYGCQVVSRDDRDTVDPDERVARLLRAAAKESRPLILVGSSMGGYVVTVASVQLAPLGLFLMAPALGLPGYAVSEPVPAALQLTVVHGWNDHVVPMANVLAFARQHQAFCHLLPAGHALHEQVEWLEQAFEEFLQRCLGELSPGADARLLACF